LIIECPHCHARYQYDESRFEAKAAKKIRCAKCQQVFEIKNPRAAAPAAGRPSSDDPLDLTVTAKKLKTREEPMPEAVQTAPVDKPPGDDKPRLPAGKRLSLAIIDGPDAGKVYRIDKPRMVIGRTGADVPLNDAETSRAHAAVEVRDMLFLLQDLGSTNGTLVDGEKINGQVELSNQGEFQIGSTTLMLIVTEEG
jgi:predicted Zn finger-like uncharacterized protein